MIPLVILGAAAAGGMLWLFFRKPPADPGTTITGPGGIQVSVPPGTTVGGDAGFVGVIGPAPAPSDPPWTELVPPPSTPAPDPAPGSTAQDPTTTPQAGKYYWVVSGDVGVRIVGLAFGLPNDGSGKRLRNWNMVKAHSKNSALGSFPAAPGDLVPQYQAPGQFPRGSGNKFPVIWIPTLNEVVP